MRSSKNRWERWLLGALGAISLMCRGQAQAGDAPAVVVNVAGRDYAAFTKGAAALAIPTPLPLRLVRDPRQQPPQCAALERALANYRVWIDDCKAAGAGGAGACQSIRNIVTTVRTDPGLVSAPNLRQGWGVEAVTESDLPAPATVAAAVSAALGVPASAVQVLDRATALGTPGDVTLEVVPNGNSWASKLLGFADIAPDALSYRSDVQRFVTEDHVLACGLLQGEVSVSFQQDGELKGEASAPLPLTASQIFSVYTSIVNAGGVPASSPLARPAQVGVRVGAALARLNLASGDLERKARLVIDVLFEGDDLVLRSSLTRAQIEALLPAPSAAVAITADLAFQIREAR